MTTFIQRHKTTQARALAARLEAICLEYDMTEQDAQSVSQIAELLYMSDHRQSRDTGEYLDAETISARTALFAQSLSRSLLAR